jgi:hypothetical protein
MEKITEYLNIGDLNINPDNQCIDMYIRYNTLRKIEYKLFNKRIEKRKLTSSFVRFLMMEKTYQQMSQQQLNEFEITRDNQFIELNQHTDEVLPDFSFEQSNQKFKLDLLLFGLTENEYSNVILFIKKTISKTIRHIEKLDYELETKPLLIRFDKTLNRINFDYDTFNYYIHYDIYQKMLKNYMKNIRINTYSDFCEFNIEMIKLIFIYCGIQGYGYQRSSCKIHKLPPETYFELFASPFNMENPVGYCSLFPFIEWKFGSNGSFINILASDKSLTIGCNVIVINPPFITEIFEILNKKIPEQIDYWREKKIEGKIHYYSSYWDDLEAIKKMMNNKYVVEREIKKIDYYDHNTMKIIHSNFESIKIIYST